MKFVEETIPKTTRDLCDRISVAMMEIPEGNFARSPISGEPYRDFDGAFYGLERGVLNLRKKLGDDRVDQILEMLAQAKAHYEVGEAKLGGALMEDTKMVVIGRRPWAYPMELYRWRVDPSLPELSEADILHKGDQGD